MRAWPIAVLRDVDLPGDWHGRRSCEILWTQDDATSSEDTVERAWRRLFGSLLDWRGSDWVASEDLGDGDAVVDCVGRVLVRSYPGANRVGVVRGSPVDVYPRVVVSGGQTGADRGALDAAIDLGWPAGGWSPLGWRAEDGQVPERHRGYLREAGSAGYASRTRDNVRDSDGTLVVSLSSQITGGSRQTWDYAGQVGRPRLHVVVEDGDADPDPGEVDRVVSWLVAHRVGVLNVAGPRESRQPGVGRATSALVRAVLLHQAGAVRARMSSRDSSARVEPGLGDSVLPSSDASIAPPNRGGRSPDLTPEVIGQDPAVVDTHAPAGSAERAPTRRTRSIGTSWSPAQDRALREVARWMASPSSPQVFYLAGVAGSGKSTLARELVAQGGGRWLFGAYTGKAALVMRRKGCDGAQTLHSMIYRYSTICRPVDSDDAQGLAQPTFRLWDESPLRYATGLVVDEGSMIDEDMGSDILSFGKKVLFLGDPAQLPPVDGGGYFSSRDPDVFLDEVHRQARDSGILDLATFVRQGGDASTRVGWSTADCEVVSRDQVGPAELMRRMSSADQVVVGRNDTRHRFNARYRTLCGLSGTRPVAGDKVVCLRNDRRTGLLNGSMWRVLATRPTGGPGTVDLDLETMDDLDPAKITTRSWVHQFEAREPELSGIGPARLGFQEFDYGYFLTCHKAQGSQWDDVVLYDESRIFRKDRARWLYTGITRAAKRLLVVV